MAGFEAPLQLTTTVPGPYVHVDNRALVLHDGRHCVMYGRASFPWLAELEHAGVASMEAVSTDRRS